MSRLQSKTAIITGASSGIGKATAERFSKEGAVIICADIKKDAVKDVADHINEQDGKHMLTI